MPATSPDGGRREQILKIGAGLLARDGVTNTTMRDIGQACGILGGSLYHHFDSKDDLIEILERRSSEFLQASYDEVLTSTEDPVERLEGLMRASFACLEAHLPASKIYQANFHYLSARSRFGFLTEMAERHKHMWMSVISAGIATGQLRREINPHLFALLVRASIWGVATWWPLNSGETLAEIEEETVRMLLVGCTRGAGARTSP